MEFARAHTHMYGNVSSMEKCVQFALPTLIEMPHTSPWTLKQLCCIFCIFNSSSLLLSCHYLVVVVVPHSFVFTNTIQMCFCHQEHTQRECMYLFTSIHTE